MHRLLDTGLEQLTTIIYKMGEVAEKALATAIEGIIKGKNSKKEVHDLSEILVTMTVEVEDKAFELIAKYQPVASDLRIINSYMKIAYDFERYGRYAWDMSYIGERLDGLKECESWIPEYVEVMSQKVLKMVRISINSLKSHDTELAKTASNIELEVDKMYFEYLDKLAKQKRTTSQCTISSVLVVRYLERVADHATYVAESVVYITTGKKLSLR